MPSARIAGDEEVHMVRHWVLRRACAIALGFGACSATLAQSNQTQTTARGDAEQWTVLTMALDGAWGVATDISVNQAIARAIRECRTKSHTEIGCGAYYTTVQAGWSLGIRCGREIIVAADRDLAEAERAALGREMDLRQHYTPGMPPCIRLLTVDPGGAIMAQSGPVDEATPTIKTAGDIPVWRTVTLGTYRDVNMLLEALDSVDCGRGEPRHAAHGDSTSRPTPCTLGDWAGQLIARPAFKMSKTPTQVDLVIVSVSELGFGADGAPIAEVHARARQLGLELCAPEVAPLLRLQYLDQPLGEFLRVAMEPIAIYSGELVELTLANGGAGLSLIGGDAGADPMAHAGARFVFMRPTRVAQPAVP
jgi:hypothetical protein